jgi:hypothetical protein
MAPRDSGDDDRPKKSWRERDAQRNRSRHVSQDPRPAQSKRERDSSGQARAALERAFSDGLVSKLVQHKLGAPTDPAAEAARSVDPKDLAAGLSAVRSAGEGGTQRSALLKKIRITESPSEVNQLIDELLAQGGELPPDWDVLIRALDHRRDTVVQKALERMTSLITTDRPPRRGALLQRLIGLLSETDDDDVRSLAEGLREKVGGA